MTLNKETNKRVNSFMESREMASKDEAHAFLIEYALNRIDVLAKHASKARRALAAVKEGRSIPKGVTFKRYVPLVNKAQADAEGTPREVAKWSHSAPVNPVIEAPVRKPRPKKKAKAFLLPKEVPSAGPVAVPAVAF